jgi:hypothetical protein
MTAHTERVYLYAIVDGDALLTQPLVGLAGAPVTLLPVQAIAAVIGPVATEQLKDTTAAALVHEQVIETLMADRRVLPVRFGTIFSTIAALTTALAARSATLRADLERLDGLVEIGVRVLWDGAARRTAADAAAHQASADAGDGPGAQYMRARMAEMATERQLRHAAETLVAAWTAYLTPHVVALATQTLVTAEIPVSIACLVQHTGVAALVDIIAQAPQQAADIRAVCTGPWPPYHFVTDAQGE